MNRSKRANAFLKKKVAGPGAKPDISRVNPTEPETPSRLLDTPRDAPPSDTDNEAERHWIRQTPKRGRKPVVTPERVQTICELLAHGESENSACLRAGIGLTAWNAAKRSDLSLRERIASARDDWARLRHEQHAAALYESQVARSAGRKALKPEPTRQAKLVAWHLTFRVPLHFAVIPEIEIVQACERFEVALKTWQRQERAFGLLRKVYVKSAKIRGERFTS